MINTNQKPTVFLGGTCRNQTAGETSDVKNWRYGREKYLKELGITCYNPLQKEWKISMIEEEATAKKDSKIQLFFLTHQGRNTVSLGEIANMAAVAANVGGKTVIVSFPDLSKADENDTVMTPLEVIYLTPIIEFLINLLKEAKHDNVIICDETGKDRCELVDEAIAEAYKNMKLKDDRNANIQSCKTNDDETVSMSIHEYVNMVTKLDDGTLGLRETIEVKKDKIVIKIACDKPELAKQIVANHAAGLFGKDWVEVHMNPLNENVCQTVYDKDSWGECWWKDYNTSFDYMKSLVTVLPI